MATPRQKRGGYDGGGSSTASGAATTRENRNSQRIVVRLTGAQSTAGEWKRHCRMAPLTEEGAAETTGESSANVDGNDGGTTGTTEAASRRNAGGRRAETWAADASERARSGNDQRRLHDRGVHAAPRAWRRRWGGYIIQTQPPVAKSEVVAAATAGAPLTTKGRQRRGERPCGSRAGSEGGAGGGMMAGRSASATTAGPRPRREQCRDGGGGVTTGVG